MIVQLERYIVFRGNPVKDNRKVKYSSDLSKIPVSCENSVSFPASFALQAAINISGTLQVGQFWSFKRDKHANKCLKCNDTSVSPEQQKSFTNEKYCSFLFTSLTDQQFP